MEKSFKKFMESNDIFGFEKEKDKKVEFDTETHPIKQFNIELMMNILANKKLGLHEANYSDFMNEIKWGIDRPGSVKLEVDTGYTFSIKRLNFDLEGNKRWATKKNFQLNRKGLGGYEDAIANSLYENIEKIDKLEVDYPMSGYKDIEKLTWKVSDKMKKFAKETFEFKGIKKLSETCFHIIFEGTVGAQDNQRIDQNITQVNYDESMGMLRINNYNIESPTGGDHNWKIKPDDLCAYFFPSQSREEIADILAVHFKYY